MKMEHKRKLENYLKEEFVQRQSIFFKGKVVNKDTVSALSCMYFIIYW